MSRSPRIIIPLLGALSVVSPFAIDMCLPAFPQMARDFGVPGTTVSLILSSYFIGLALGQVFYGPLLDRFGRKPPLIWGLGVFIVATIGCALVPDINALIGLRFVQALAGCAAEVAALAMVRDFFPVKDNARILSLLFLFIAASPLLAPSIGGLVIVVAGWRAVFLLMGLIVTAILMLTIFVLPEAHKPDPGVSLMPGPALREYWSILRTPQFFTYALSSAFSFAGLFSYVAGAPIIFMEGFGLDTRDFSMVFAFLSVGFIGSSQVNVALLRRFDPARLFRWTLMVQAVVGAFFILGAWFGWYGLPGTLVLLFLLLSCAGLSYPNGAALAMAPFERNAGSASAMLGFLQLGVGSLISAGIAATHARESFPVIAIIAVTSLVGLALLLIGQRCVREGAAGAR